MELNHRTALTVANALRKAPPHVGEKMQLLIRAGSHAYGLALSTSDVDLRGFCLAPRASYTGFVHPFEQFSCKDPDATVMDVKTFMRGCAAGLPDVLQCLFCEEEDVLVTDWAGVMLREKREHFLSQKVVKPFAGYARGMIAKVRYHTSDKPNAGQNFDVGKAAMHAIRAVTMLKELLRYGAFNVRRHSDAEYMLRIRNNPQDAAMYADVAEGTLACLDAWLASGTRLPEAPNMGYLNQLCMNIVEKAD